MNAPAATVVAGGTRELLRSRLGALGFDEVRFAAIGAEAGDTFKQWLDAGMHGDMAWMERSAEKRAKADLVLSGARSVILLGVTYWAAEPGVRKQRTENRPRWARYAQHADYHDTMRPGLEAAGR